MPVKHTGKGNFAKALQRMIDNKTQSIITMFENIGNECVREMRENSNRYTDQTNNLRSSTGYVVVMDGRIVRSSGFAPIRKNANGGDGTEGASTGEALASEEASKIGKGKIALILVAGMNYAVYVESKGLNVMDSAKALARREIPAYMRDVFGK